MPDGIAQAAVAPAGGLSSAEAADRLARYGPNELPRARRTSAWRMVADQLRDPLILVLLAAVVLTVATGDLADASVIVLVIVVNTAVGVVQEVKADQADRGDHHQLCASSTSSAAASVTSASAGTMSPSASTSTSPVTTSAAGICRC